MRLASRSSRDQPRRRRGVSGWVGARAKGAEDKKPSRAQLAQAPDQGKKAKGDGANVWSPNRFRRKSNGQSARVRPVAVVSHRMSHKGQKCASCTVERSSVAKRKGPCAGQPG